MKNIKLFFILLLSCTPAIIINGQEWRSALYPENWQPGFTDSEGRFLHDFSYAGYHSGLKEIPHLTTNIVNVTSAPYYADNTGKKDVTNTLQQAVRDLSRQGGGVLYLPEGTYLMRIPEGKNIGLSIVSSNIVIRGEGPQKTFIKNATTQMRQKMLIRFYSPNASWSKDADKQVKLAEDVLLPSTTIPVENVSSFKKGDLVIIKTDVTPAFREEHGVGEQWDKVTRGVCFFREIVSVNEKSKTLEIDVPTRYFLKKRDNARVYVAPPQISECGIENLSIGNVEHPNAEGWEEEDYTDEEMGSYDVHGSQLIEFRNAYNCWAKNVHSYRPEENKLDIHVLSNCLRISESRFITVEQCNFQKSQSKTGGGNGYLYTLQGNDCLIKDCHAEQGRHNFSFSNMWSNGNVIYNCFSKDSYLSTDFHMHLSMANLIDCFQSDGDYIEAKFRPWGARNARHMHGTTQSVIWNTNSLKAHQKGFLIMSRQFGNGYVIGTSGVVTNVVATPVSGKEGGVDFDTSPADWVEGEGAGDTLYPQSLYLDQLAKRKYGLSTD